MGGWPHPFMNNLWSTWLQGLWAAPSLTFSGYFTVSSTKRNLVQQSWHQNLYDYNNYIALLWCYNYDCAIVVNSHNRICRYQNKLYMQQEVKRNNYCSLNVLAHCSISNFYFQAIWGFACIVRPQETAEDSSGELYPSFLTYTCPCPLLAALWLVSCLSEFRPLLSVSL